MMKRLAEEKDVQEAVAKVHHNVDFLVLHQTAWHTDTGEGILEELAKPQLTPSSLLIPKPGHSFPHVTAHNHSTVHLGDVYNVGSQEPEKVRSLGLCLHSAPVIHPNDFIGRAAEINSMHEILLTGEAYVEQRRLVLGGIGGMGKTQLAIAYARRHHHKYTSVLWLNATSELTLKASFRSMMQGVITAEELEKLSDGQVLARAHGWLCLSTHADWLLIFDNYDDPDQYDIDICCPSTCHGSVLITTRLPELVKGQLVRVESLQDIGESLDILQTRSRRQNVKDGKFASVTCGERLVRTD